MSLLSQHCRPQAVALDDEAIEALLPQVPGWARIEATLTRSFGFRNYHETLEFVNALAWMVHNEDHHPTLVVTYKECLVRYDTHSVKGISANDFICAAKASAIYAQRTGA